MNIKDFAKPDWGQIWAGSWSLLTCSQFAGQYTKTLDIAGHGFMSQAIFFMKDGKSSCYMTKTDKDALGKHLAKKAGDNPELMLQVADNLKHQVDLNMDFMKKYENSEITKEIYEEFWNHIAQYYTPHINVKYIVDYLDPAILEKYMHTLEEARVYAEPVFKHSEDLMQSMAKQIGKRTGYKPELVLCMLQEELLVFWESGILPEQEMLQQRYEKSSLLADSSGRLLVLKDEVAEIEKLVFINASDSKTLKGSVAFPGKVKGVVRIIHDPMKADNFNEGDILVTGMTRPEFLSLMQKSSAVITDAGGILSHAAISARELKKPCIIGTNHATKVLKDGDMVEVDADKGIVNIL